MTQSSTGSTATQKANGYLQQLCKHWSHKAEVSFTPEAGDIRFPNGNHLSLTAHPDHLEMRLDVPADVDLAKFQDVVDKHILRFAFREDLEISWAAA
ncbi:DUF2218 domain-containing protein [Shimia thalassica]|uniref:DUF2218 domain-containing protein n=1 Tax=Shimia thalassica TaxID=1715693 RepID=UPI002734C195|nr:DUF2218 domain-containing protein [Shimia thalassica]MDP2579535.1 DUF2218 domain-containing protein [Shimia thalassica]